MTDEDQAREWLLAQGWTTSNESWYDEEGIEAVRWEPPDLDNYPEGISEDDCGEMSDWGDPPVVPDALIEYWKENAS